MGKSFLNKKNCLSLLCLVVLGALVYLCYYYVLPNFKTSCSLKEGLNMPCNMTYPRINNRECPDGFLGIGCSGGCPGKPTTGGVNWADNCGCWPKDHEGDENYKYDGVRKELYDKGNFVGALNPKQAVKPTQTQSVTSEPKPSVSQPVNSKSSGDYSMNCKCVTQE